MPALLKHAAELGSDSIDFDTDYAGCGCMAGTDIGFGAAQSFDFVLKTEFHYLVIIQSAASTAALVDIEIECSARLHCHLSRPKLPVELPWAYTDMIHHLHVASMKRYYGHREDGSLLSRKIHLFYDTAF